MKVSKSKILFLSMALLSTFPQKIISLGLVIFFVILLTVRVPLDKRRVFILSILLLASIMASVLNNGAGALQNATISFLFILPVLIFVSTSRNAVPLCSKETTKSVIEYFLIVQIVFSLLNAAYFFVFVKSGGLDTNFGDVVAGTFRVPFNLYEDSSNKVFSFTMIIVSALYVYSWGLRDANKYILVFCAIVIFLASVNHLIAIAIVCGLAVVGVRIKPLLVSIIGFVALIFLYQVLQPTNYMLFEQRIDLIMNSDLKSAAASIDKVQYFVTSGKVFADNWFSVITLGLGPGTYASRAAHFMGGTLVPSFPLHFETPIFHNYISPLYYAFDAKPQYSKGAFYFPYDDTLSLFFEYGLTFLAISFFAFRAFYLYFGRAALFFIGMFLLAGFVDHYFEYYNETFIFILFTLMLGRQNDHA